MSGKLKHGAAFTVAGVTPAMKSVVIITFSDALNVASLNEFACNAGSYDA